jgi:hypothetical protein
MNKQDLQIKWSKPNLKTTEKDFLAVVAEGDVERHCGLQIGFQKI